MIRIVVASKNPVKLNAALEGFRQVFSDEIFEIDGVSVASGVADQPMSNAETLNGALNRTRAAQSTEPDADYWVGIEGGVQDSGDALEAFAWVVVVDRSGRVGKGRTGAYFLPDETARLVRSGVELGHADDQVFGRSNSKHDSGSVGILTHDIITRTTYYIHAVILALIPFVNPQLTFPNQSDS